MEQKQLDRMENMLSNLIKIVGTLKNDFEEMKEEMAEVKEEIKEVKKDLQEVRNDTEVLKKDTEVLKKDTEVLKKDIEVLKKEQAVTINILTDMRADQDYIWEKAVKNERDLAKLKRHLQL